MKILRLPQVLDITGKSKSSQYAMLNPNSDTYDESFPKSVSIGLRSKGWIEQEVIDWVQQKMDERA
jgi:prophage regulatory protein